MKINFGALLAVIAELVGIGMTADADHDGKLSPTETRDAVVRVVIAISKVFPNLFPTASPLGDPNIRAAFGEKLIVLMKEYFG